MKKAFYPPLIAIFLVLALFNANSHQLVSPTVVGLPLLVSIGVACVLWSLGRLVLKSWNRAALPACILTIMLLEYGHFRGAFGLDEAVTLTAWTAIFVMIALAVVAIRGTPTVAFNVISICLVLTALVPFGVFVLNAPTPRAGSNDSILEDKGAPDIYYIIVDEYSRNDVLLDMCGFDNSEFTDWLRSRGFCVAEDSYASYPATVLSLTSVLSMNYLPEKGDSWHVQELYNLLLDNEVCKQLKQRGYTFVNVASSWGVDAFLEGYAFNGHNEFTYLFREMSMFYVTETRARRYYNHAIYQFDKLKEVAQMSESTFTLVHLMMTHAPYVFNTDGSFRGYHAPAGEGWYEAYVDQIKAANKLLRETIEAILAEGDAIIILQSDTGTQPRNFLMYMVTHNGTLNNIAQEDPYTVWARLANLNAVYPDCGVELTSPVNTFRVILNYHFDTDYEILLDRHFFTMREPPPFEIFEVTDALKEYTE